MANKKPTIKLLTSSHSGRTYAVHAYIKAPLGDEKLVFLDPHGAQSPGDFIDEAHRAGGVWIISDLEPIPAHHFVPWHQVIEIAFQGRE